MKRRTFSAPPRQLWHLFRYRYFRTHAQFSGGPDEICRQIVDKCWNGTFYTTSIGNFDYFWIRDFAAVAKSLRQLGHVDRVRATLTWALVQYMEEDAVTSCITPSGRLFDAPKPGIDTLPSLLHCVWSAKYSLNVAERAFLNRQLELFTHEYLDETTGLIRPGIDAAELRDGVKYDRSAYSVSMVERMAWSAEQLDLTFSYPSEIYRTELVDHYWNGEYFNADYENTAFSADCALVPFIMRSVEDATMLRKTLDYVQKRSLATPYPIRYTDTPRKFYYRWWAKTVMRNYAGDTIWTWHGAYYLRLLYGENRAEAVDVERDFRAMLKRYHTFPELLHPDGRLYNSLLYKSSEGMIWAAIYLTVDSYKPKS